MTVKVIHTFEDYHNVAAELTACCALANSNEDYVLAVLSDVNKIIESASNSKDIEEYTSDALIVLVDNASENGEEITDGMLKIFHNQTAKLVVDVLSTIMSQVDGFYDYEIDVESSKLWESKFGPLSAYVRMQLDRVGCLDDDQSPDATRVVSLFYHMYNVTGADARYVRDEIHSIARCS